MNWKSLLIIIATMAVGVLLVNQSLGYFYKVQFLKTPCDLCEELNPHLKPCFKSQSQYKLNQLTGEVMEGSPEVIKELNRREGKNYTNFDWFINKS